MTAAAGVVEVGTGCDYCEALTEMVLISDTDPTIHQHWISLVHHQPGCWPAAFADPWDGPQAVSLADFRKADKWGRVCTP